MSTLQDIIYKGDKATFVHWQDNTQTLQYVHDVKNSTDRGMIRSDNPDGFNGQHVGEIPVLEYLRIIAIRPELGTDDKLLYRWLMSDEGAGYRIASGEKTRCANIIIK